MAISSGVAPPDFKLFLKNKPLQTSYVLFMLLSSVAIMEVLLLFIALIGIRMGDSQQN